MRKILFWVPVLLLGFSLVGCMNVTQQNQVNNGSQQSDETDMKAVAGLVENFGKKLQMVSLLAPSDILKKSMQDNYGGLVESALLEKWLNDPQNAPGRLVSSPWPDRIEIISNQKLANGSYEVKGKIIEITSAEQGGDGFAAKRPITLIIKKTGGSWLIDDVTMGAYENANSIIYNNTQYGFKFTLPKSWENYSIVNGKWEGMAISGPRSGKVIENGEIISIRHPQWTDQNPRQDIPIMIFTLAQWNAVQNEEMSVGAAPIAPSELGRNSKYVFALPARYNYAFPTGYEEVETILASKPLQPAE
jgi:hypothetical protein